MFEEASRLKFRFDTPQGLLSVEDLWELPLTSPRSTARANLDDIARGLHHALRHDDNVSFVNVANKSDPTIQMKFDLVKHIIDVRLTANAAEAKRHEDAEKKQRLLSILKDREDESFKSMSVDELRKAIEAL